VQVAQVDYLRRSPHWHAEQVFFVPGYGTLIAYSYSAKKLTEESKWFGIKFPVSSMDAPLAIRGETGVGIVHYSSVYAPEWDSDGPLQWLPAAKVGLRLKLLAASARPVIFHARGTSGPARKDANRTLIVSNNQKKTAYFLSGGSDEIWVKLDLQRGFNDIDFAVGEENDARLLPEADRRSLMLMMSSPTLICPGPDGKLPERSVEGYSVIEGMGPAEGPFPKWGLDIIHWARGPQTRLCIDGGRGSSVRLSFSCKTDFPGQALKVLLDGIPVTTEDLLIGQDFSDLEVPLELAPGKHEVTFRYLVSPPSPAGLTVLFRRLQVIHFSDSLTTNPTKNEANE
jgi:hypothetical protein